MPLNQKSLFSQFSKTGQIDSLDKSIDRLTETEDEKDSSFGSKNSLLAIKSKESSRSLFSKAASSPKVENILGDVLEKSDVAPQADNNNQDQTKKVELEHKEEEKKEVREIKRPPMLQSRGSKKNLMKKPQEFKEDSLPDLSPTKIEAKSPLRKPEAKCPPKNPEIKIQGFSMLTNENPVDNEKVEKVEPKPIALENIEPEKPKPPVKSGNPAKKGGKFMLQRSSTVSLDVKEKEAPVINNGMISPRLKKVNEEAEKKLKEELEASNKHIQILNLIIAFADKPRDLGGNINTYYNDRTNV